jgi:hypothetical protein
MRGFIAGIGAALAKGWRLGFDFVEAYLHGWVA